MAWYFTVYEFPERITRHEAMWLPLGIISSNIAKAILGGLSHVFKDMEKQRKEKEKQAKAEERRQSLMMREAEKEAEAKAAATKRKQRWRQSPAFAKIKADASKVLAKSNSGLLHASTAAICVEYSVRSSRYTAGACRI